MVPAVAFKIPAWSLCRRSGRPARTSAPPLDELDPPARDVLTSRRPRALAVVPVNFDVVTLSVPADSVPRQDILTALRFSVYAPHVPDQRIHRCCRRDVGGVIGEDQSSMSERRKRIPPVAAWASPPASSPASGDPSAAHAIA